MALGLNGDTQAGTAVKVAVVDNQIPVVAAADIADKDNSINITTHSGKRFGSCIINGTTGEIMVAQGAAATDDWKNQGPVAAVVTPA